MSEKTDAGLLMSAIVKLADRGFGESEFRGSTAMAVERLIGKGVRIDQAIIDLYRQWLLGREETVAEVMDSSTDEEAPDQAATEAAEAGDPSVRSLLWGYGGVSIVPAATIPYSKRSSESISTETTSTSCSRFSASPSIECAI